MNGQKKVTKLNLLSQMLIIDIRSMLFTVRKKEVQAYAFEHI